MRRRHVARRAGLIVLVAVPSLAAATAVTAILEAGAAIPNASAVYLVAVVVSAVLTGTAGAVVAAAGSFLLYNFLFTEPRYSLVIHDPDVWLSAVLLLFVGIVVGQLVALQRARADLATEREREARALFRLSRVLATRSSTADILPEIVRLVGEEARADWAWIGLGDADGSERVAARDPRAEQVSGPIGLVSALQRTPGDEPARWVRVHLGQGGGGPGLAREHRAGDAAADTFRVRVTTAGATFGSIWVVRPRRLGPPDRAETRVLAAAADQLGQAIALDRLTADAQAAEVARRSDVLKSALLQSVSHDLRSPLATIRAAAGTLGAGRDLDETDRRASAEAIEREVEYLDRLVTNLLDLSRIQAGELRAEVDVFELDDVLGPTLERLRARLAGWPLTAALDATAIVVDPTYIDAIVSNLLDNVVRHTPPGTPVRIGVDRVGVLPGRVRVVVEDAGPGVPDDALPHLFERFYRVPRRGVGARAGTGIGLAVVHGLAIAMGARVEARPSELGGLAIVLELPAAPIGAGATPARDAEDATLAAGSPPPVAGRPQPAPAP